jgi:hypothetical protein
VISKLFLPLLFLIVADFANIQILALLFRQGGVVRVLFIDGLPNLALLYFDVSYNRILFGFLANI